jgi:hypothetical protein
LAGAVVKVQAMPTQIRGTPQRHHDGFDVFIQCLPVHHRNGVAVDHLQDWCQLATLAGMRSFFSLLLVAADGRTVGVVSFASRRYKAFQERW